MIFLFVFWIACGWLGFTVAEAKGLSAASWSLACIFLGPLGLIALAGMPDRHTRAYLKYLAEDRGWKGPGDVPARLLSGKLSDKSSEENFKIACRLYQNAGGRSVPGFAQSRVGAKLIALKDYEGKTLAYITENEGAWVVSEVFR